MADHKWTYLLLLLTLFDKSRNDIKIKSKSKSKNFKSRYAEMKFWHCLRPAASEKKLLKFHFRTPPLCQIFLKLQQKYEISLCLLVGLHFQVLMLP